MHCPGCDVEWSRASTGDRCEHCGREGEPGFPSSGFEDTAGRWRPEDLEQLA